MKANMNSTDRIIRAIIAVLFTTLFFTGVIPGVIGMVLVAVSVIFLITSFISYCPIYGIFGWRTKKAS